MISKKMIIIKKNCFTVKNVYIAIYQYINEITKLDTFK